MKEFKIVKPSIWKRHVELQTVDNESIGNITWKNAFSYNANIEGIYSSWKLRTNTWCSKITILNEWEEEVGEVKINSWNGCTKLHYQGMVFSFKLLSWNKYVYLWRDIDGDKVMSFKPHYFSSKKVGSVRSYHEMDEKFEELLMHLGWYLVAVKMSQAGAAAA